MRNNIKVEKARGEKVYAAAQRGCVEERGGYLARDQFSKPKKGETEKSPSKARRVVDWAGEEKG